MSETKDKLYCKVIVIAGADGSGKSTLANKLASQLAQDGYVVYRDAFANGLRQMVAEKEGVPTDELYAKPTPEHIRKLLRDKAKQYKAEAGDNGLFAKMARKRLIYAFTNYSTDIVIIDDNRYVEELCELKRHRDDGAIFDLYTVYLSADIANAQLIEPSFADLPIIMNHFADYVHFAKPDAETVYGRLIHDLEA